MIATVNYDWGYIGERLALLPEPDFWDAWESLGQAVRALCKVEMMSNEAPRWSTTGLGATDTEGMRCELEISGVPQRP